MKIVQTIQGGEIMTTKVEQAKEVLEEKNNGVLYGLSSSKGGRAWVDGEWTLEELEALCILIREQAGQDADGFVYRVPCTDCKGSGLFVFLGNQLECRGCHGAGTVRGDDE